MDFNKIVESVTNSWQLKTVVSFFVTCLSFLFGEVQAPLLALCLLIIVDTVTKWGAVSKAKSEEKKLGSIREGFYSAWHDGTLNSKTMRQKFFKKAFSYAVLIMSFNLAMKCIPPVVLFGSDWSKFPLGFIYSFLSMTEVMSIVENLIEMGMDALRPLSVFLSKKRNELKG